MPVALICWAYAKKMAKICQIAALLFLPFTAWFFCYILLVHCYSPVYIRMGQGPYLFQVMSADFAGWQCCVDKRTGTNIAIDYRSR